MEFLSFRAVCVSTAIVEKTNQNIFPHTNPYISKIIFRAWLPVVHEITVEDVRSDCFHSGFHHSPMKGLKLSWNGKS